MVQFLIKKRVTSFAGHMVNTGHSFVYNEAQVLVKCNKIFLCLIRVYRDLHTQ